MVHQLGCGTDQELPHHGDDAISGAGGGFQCPEPRNFFIGNVSFTPSGTSFDINSPNFGRVNTTFDPRIIQFVGRFEF